MGTGKSLKYTNWKPGQPSGDGDCVEVNFYKPGLWNDKPRHVSRKFMCERGFPEDYKYNEKSRRAFKLHNTKKNWQDAQQTCQMEGGNLVTVDTSEINNILKSKKKRIWIGASDLETEETFLWTNGKPLSYNSWAPGEPNNHGNREDCVEVNFRSPGLWNDRPCHKERKFMCEIGPVVTGGNTTNSPQDFTSTPSISGLNNGNVECWNEPGNCKQAGPCPRFCGEGGTCCRQGWTDGEGCTGENGCKDNHCCVKKMPTPSFVGTANNLWQKTG